MVIVHFQATFPEGNRNWGLQAADEGHVRIDLVHPVAVRSNLHQGEPWGKPPQSELAPLHHQRSPCETTQLWILGRPSLVCFCSVSWYHVTRMHTPHIIYICMHIIYVLSMFMVQTCSNHYACTNHVQMSSVRQDTNQNLCMNLGAFEFWPTAALFGWRNIHSLHVDTVARCC